MPSHDILKVFFLMYLLLYHKVCFKITLVMIAENAIDVGMQI
jgi:hypothetical protein